MRKSLVGLLSLALAAGCGVPKDQFAAKERDAQNYKKQFEDEAARRAASEAKGAELQKQLELAKASTVKLEKEKVVLEQKSSQYEQLNKSLEKQISSGQIELSELRGKMTVKLKDKILFASGSAKIGKEGKAALDAVADAFKNLKGKDIVVSGYTDDVPTGTKLGFTDNWDLSTARAISVVRYLQSKGVAPEMLGAMGYSEYRPLAPNDSNEGRSQNRRIEISLMAAENAPAAAGQKQ